VISKPLPKRPRGCSRKQNAIEENNKEEEAKQTTSGRKGAMYINYSNADVAAALKEAVG
jgi:hypothetical protein